MRQVRLKERHAREPSRAAYRPANVPPMRGVFRKALALAWLQETCEAR
jgi:hypothetical protein